MSSSLCPGSQALSLLFMLFTLSVTSAANLTVHYLDVGQGDASLIIYGGQTILIDSGGMGTEQGNKLKRYLADAGVSGIDLAVATHSDPDHIGQFTELMQQLNVAELWHNGLPSQELPWKTLNETANNLGVQRRVIRRGDGFILGEETFLYALGPIAPLFDDQDSDSIVLRLVFKKLSFLFTGDADSRAETRMVEVCGPCLGSDVLKLGDHGAPSSTTEQFLDTVQPYVAIMSAGQGDPGGHPHDELLQRLVARNIFLFRTDIHEAMIDDVVATTDGHSLLLTQQSTGTIWKMDELAIRMILLLSIAAAIVHSCLRPDRLVPVGAGLVGRSSVMPRVPRGAQERDCPSVNSPANIHMGRETIQQEGDDA